MIKIRKIMCLLRAIPEWLSYGVFAPHTYRSTMEPAIIISTEDGFRVAQNYCHTQEETVHKNAGLIRSRCIYCGKETLSWFQNWKERGMYE